MSYRLKRSDCTVTDGVRRVALSQIDAAIAELDDDSLDVHETIHQVRKRCKKLRGLIRLVRPAFADYKAENAQFRAAAAVLSRLRDAEAMTETYDDLVEACADQIERRDFAIIRRRLTERKNRLAEDEGLDEALASCRQAMVDARVRAGGWALDAENFDAIGGGLKNTYKRAETALAVARDDPSPHNLHQLRKRVKYHRYHTGLLRGIWPAVLSAHRNAADRLGDLLGMHHNYAVFRDLLAKEREAIAKAEKVEAFDALIERRQAHLAGEALGLAEKLFAQDAKSVRKVWRTYWRVWRDEQRIYTDARVAAREAANTAVAEA